ncbi:hypothetical protein [Azohydromonas australica]|uniref:hypothetical protein n=1 Tax=Azohydromonas australica TaxID=364039 RepID=UPI00040DE4CD|nr:hypothetical protein [Azohydromonas australica]
MGTLKQLPDPLGKDIDELARTESMTSRCEARITAQLELLASLSPWEPKSRALRKEVDIEEGVLLGLQAHRLRLLSAMRDSPNP